MYNKKRCVIDETVKDFLGWNTLINKKRTKRTKRTLRILRTIRT